MNAGATASNFEFMICNSLANIITSNTFTIQGGSLPSASYKFTVRVARGTSYSEASATVELVTTAGVRAPTVSLPQIVPEISGQVPFSTEPTLSHEAAAEHLHGRLGGC